jgi:hypothetical protein
MVAVRGDEDLGLVTETAEGNGVDDAVAIALEGVAGSASAAAILGVETAAALGGIGGVGGQRPH